MAAVPPASHLAHQSGPHRQPVSRRILSAAPLLGCSLHRLQFVSRSFMFSDLLLRQSYFRVFAQSGEPKLPERKFSNKIKENRPPPPQDMTVVTQPTPQSWWVGEISEKGQLGGETSQGSLNDDANNDEDSSPDLMLAHRLFDRPTTKGTFADLRRQLQPVLLKRLRQLAEMEPSWEVGLEIADSLYILKLLRYSHPQLDFVREKAVKGALLLQKGEGMVMGVQDLLRSAQIDLVSTSAPSFGQYGGSGNSIA